MGVCGERRAKASHFSLASRCAIPRQRESHYSPGGRSPPLRPLGDRYLGRSLPWFHTLSSPGFGVEVPGGVSFVPCCRGILLILFLACCRALGVRTGRGEFRGHDCRHEDGCRSGTPSSFHLPEWSDQCYGGEERRSTRYTV